MSVAVFAIALAFFIMMASVGMLIIDNFHLASQAREAQIKAARTLAIYEAAIGVRYDPR